MPGEMDLKDIFDTGGEVPPATPAATLVIFRNAPAGGPPELLMVQRAKEMRFAGGAAVFPGGRVDDADFALAEALGAADEDHRDELAARIAAVRETLEETGWHVELTGVVGIYLYTAPSNGITYQRVCFSAKPLRHDPELELDDGIIGPRWMSRDELAADPQRWRSELVLRCVDDYLAGVRYPLALVTTDATVFAPECL